MMNLRPALVLLASALAADAGAPLGWARGEQDWTRFRGPNGTGVSDSTSIPVTWAEADFTWRIKIPGKSHSAPVVWGDHLFLESAEVNGSDRILLCLRKKDGQEAWSKKHPMRNYKINGLNSFASSTPAVDADRVYAIFADSDQYVVKAWDHAGKEAWSVNLGTFKSQHGMATSPIIYDGKLIVTNDQDAESFIIALDVKTGKQVWKSPRRNTEQSTAYGTPTVLERKGLPTQILTTSAAHGIAGLDAKTGQMLWEAKVFDKRAVSSPVVVGDLVFGSCGSGGGGNYVAAVKLGGKGDVTTSHLAYTVRDAAPYVPTPVASGNRLFLVSDNGIASCVEASTGKVLWKERVAQTEKRGLVWYGSPVLVGGRVYCVSSAGEAVVFAAADEFKILARNPLGEGMHSTPTVDGDRMYFKTFTHLVCVGGK